MRIIMGFVGAARMERNMVLFGKATSNAEWRCENLETNGIAPFSTVAEASQAAGVLRRRSFQSVIILALRMKIAETENDIRKLRRRRRLIVIMHGEGQTTFWGQPSLVQSMTIYGSYLTANGLKPFYNFDAAEQCAWEVRRQGLSCASVATFHLKPTPAPSRSAIR